MQKALIIDDNRAMADSMKQMLSLLSIDAQVAYGSRAGIAALKDLTPKIVFLDINMPGVSGFEVMAYLQREPRLESVPVIIVTSDDQEETATKVTEAGAKGIVIKPVTVEAIESALQKAEINKGDG
ncbi:MAG: response regulator [Chloroflexi bacterium]|nr:response regulator [Chloroflexota bacterium]